MFVCIGPMHWAVSSPRKLPSTNVS